MTDLEKNCEVEDLEELDDNNLGGNNKESDN